ncbi:hypothetical protein EON63_17410 [archaeon]|nr:MAG: hypothetical protein EON63_17410 [archaeon]
MVFQQKLHLMGGTPLNNEVWVLNNVTRVGRREPSTRSLYSNYTFDLNWTRLPDVSMVYGVWCMTYGIMVCS